MEAREKRRVVVKNAINLTTGTFSIEVSTDVKMELWRG
jgi:hypothetical protein